MYGVALSPRRAVAVRMGIDAHDRQQREIGRQAVLTKNRAQAWQVRRATREALLGRPPEGRQGAEAVLPYVDTPIREPVEFRGRWSGRPDRGDACGFRGSRRARGHAAHRRTPWNQGGQRGERQSAAHAAEQQEDCPSRAGAARHFRSAQRVPALAARGAAFASAASAFRSTALRRPRVRSMTVGGKESTRA